MKSKMLIKAVTKFKNILLLAIVLGVFLVTDSLPFLLVGAAGYIYFIMQTLKDPEFMKEFNKAMQFEGIQDLNQECDRLYQNVFRRLPGGLRDRIRNVYKEKQALVAYYVQTNSDPIKERIVEQALNLVIVYLKLMHNYNIRIREVNTVNAKRFIDRINANKKKQEFLTNQKAIADLQRAVELDEKILERINNEKSELQMISSKLDYIESAILMFKHQIVSNTNSDPIIEDIDNVVNEAIALESVLTSHRNDKLRL
ncbi:hypothetical protein [Acetivibrio mesophilus]|uniref:5-bromo-4-chloroindolyl phosphate hydrolysis protein n=1 Tax=Acetivibrio mesophilus TaxID=2487273 RepID=A0A4Q0I4E1_9FIRM|nr:hypothetical protein [Acetivibrio mesophilus]ODM26064.1 hypothetical protein A7W90_07390 [Clostridium sp. Bc-iso-3]RXE59138.1 hypothetical protein EFD62_08295 [Acetivibrio mesophilus]HHV28270.1 hypothetical protein [Clostridium sp.]